MDEKPMPHQSRQLSILEAEKMATNMVKNDQVLQSEQVCKSLLQLQPLNQTALVTLHHIEHKRKNYGQAIGYLQRLIDNSITTASIYSNIGLSCIYSEHFTKAQHYLEQALNIDKHFFAAHINLALLYTKLAKTNKTIFHLEQALKIQPNDPRAHLNYAHALLRQRHFIQGWQEYEWRYQLSEFSYLKRHYQQPLWRGENLHGKRILVYMEQGYGDVIQFIRLLTLLKQQHTWIIFECHPSLHQLLSDRPYIDKLVATGNKTIDFDTHIPLLGLAHRLAIDLTKNPVNMPYLIPQQDLIDHFQALIVDHKKFNIGITWGGNPHHYEDRFRSCPLSQFIPLTKISSVQLYSLQFGCAAQEINKFPQANIIPLHEKIHNFADTIAAMQCLDLMISVDTATIHLAGATQQTAWLILAFASEWRWLENTDKCAWYPSIRLFRQPALLDWESVFINVTKTLEQKLVEK